MMTHGVIEPEGSEQTTRQSSGAATADDATSVWGCAAWIGDGKALPAREEDFYENDPAPQFRRIFCAGRRIASARLMIAGLGFHEAHLNGQPLTDCALAPLWTPYRHRVLYDTHDVTVLLREGPNVLTATLGNGWYNPLPMRMWGMFNLRGALEVGRPCLIARLDIRYEDGSCGCIVSDAGWKVSDGPLLRNSLHLGEWYDARMETSGWRQVDFDDSTWRQATVVEGPGGALLPREAPPISVRDSWMAIEVHEPMPGVYVADMGRNFSGLAPFSLGKGESGRMITFRYGELLNRDGTVNVMTTVCGQIKRDGMAGPGAPALAEQKDVFVRRGGGEESFAPRFVWHGFRYVQIDGLEKAPGPSDITAVALSSALADASSFDCSKQLFNDIHRVCRQTFLSNLMGVQSDCPARERFGYGGDIAATTESFLFLFDMETFYAKTVQDFIDEAEDGWFTETAPFVGIADRGAGGRSGPIGWTVGVPVMIQALYRYYGNRTLMARHYGACVRYVELVRARYPDLIIPSCIGDHEALDKADESLTGTAHFFQWVSLVAEFATVLEHADDARTYTRLAEAIRCAFQARFVVGGKVGRRCQGEQLFGLYHRLIPESERLVAVDLLRQDIASRGGALSTGIFGTKYLLEVLSTEGLEDLAGSLVSRREYPGWGYMLDNGATTLWETWSPSDDVFSQNHPMFGSVEEWFMKHVLGISPAPDAVGCDRLVIRPQAVCGLTWACGHYNTPKGPVCVSWRLDADRPADGVRTEGMQTEGIPTDNRMHLTLELPQGVTARVWLAAERKWAEAKPGKQAWN